jgi:hypothetical protein
MYSVLRVRGKRTDYGSICGGAGVVCGDLPIQLSKISAAEIFWNTKISYFYT